MFKRQPPIQEAPMRKTAGAFSLPRRHAAVKGYRKTAALLEFGTRFTGVEDTSAVMEETLRALVRDTGGDIGYLMLFGDDDETLTAELAISIGQKREFPRTRRIGEGVEGFVAASGEAQMLARNARKRGPVSVNFDYDGEAMLCVPLRRTNADGSVRQICGTLTVASCRPGSSFNERDLELAQSLAALSVVTLANESRYRNLRGSFLKSLQAMARAIEAKVPFMEGHGDRVAQVCVELGKRLGLTEDVLDDLRSGAQLHEIGKIGIPDTILLKPGQLTPEEFAALKHYPVIGYEMCKPLGLGEQVLTLIRNHPERLDGTGYPDKLKYGELPLPLRILCVADAFDAMSSYRPYRQVMDKKARQEQLNRFAGTQFDPIVVETLKGLLADGRLEDLYQEHWAKYADSVIAPAAQQPALVREQQPESTREEAAATAPTAPPKIYLADVSQTSEDSRPPEAMDFDDDTALVAEALSSIGVDPVRHGFSPHGPAGGDIAPSVSIDADIPLTDEIPVERKLTLEEAAMEAAAFAAEALEAANRKDLAA